MSENLGQIATALAKAGSDFYLRGWVLGTSGNLSAVVQRDPLRLAITASGVDKGALRAEHILVINENARVINGSAGKPSDESLLHLRIVNQRGAAAVCHTHSIWGTLLSDFFSADGGLAIEGYEMLKGLSDVKTHEHREWLAILENSQDMTGLADRVGETLTRYQGSHGFLLRRHGLYTWGNDLAQAKRHVEVLEFLLETIGRMLLTKRHGD